MEQPKLPRKMAPKKNINHGKGNKGSYPLASERGNMAKKVKLKGN